MERIEDLVEPRHALSSAAQNLVFNEKVKSMIESGVEDLAHFAFGESPFPVPDPFVEALQLYAGVHSYLPMRGTEDLRKCLSSFHAKYDNLDLDPENFLVAPGSKELIFLTINMFNGVILLTSPTWSTYDHQCRLAGKRPLILHLQERKGWKVTPQAIKKGMEHLAGHNRKEHKLLIITNPGNPSGTCYTKSELTKLRDCCRSNNIFVLSDEIYARLTFQGSHESLLHSVPPINTQLYNLHPEHMWREGNSFYPEGTILTSGFSKWASAGGWRIGYAYFPPSLSSLYKAVYKCGSNTYSCAPAPMQYAVAKALTESLEELENYIRCCSSLLKLVGDYCYLELQTVGVTGNRSEAGYYYMPNFEIIRNGLKKRGILTSAQLAQALLNDIHVAVLGAEEFLRPPEELTVRFCFVCFDGSGCLRAYQDCLTRGEILLATNEEGRSFLEANCNILVKGIERIKAFVKNHLGE